MKERLIRQRELTARLNTYRDEYYNQNAPSVSDAVYDRLFDELTELEEETGVVMSNSPTQTVGYPVVSRLPQAKHDIPLLSLDKTKLISELLAFQDGRTVDFSLKLDGLTTEIIYEGGLLQRLSTRGDGDIGEDITHNAEAIEGIPVQIPYKERLVVAGESFIHCNDFERLRQKLVDSTGKPYRNSRNLAAGSVRAYNSAVCAKRCVHFLPFAVIEGLPEIEAETDSKRMKLAKLTEFGFGRVRSIQFATANNDMMDLHIKVLRDKAAEEDLPIDGLVMTYDSISYSRTCGRTGHHFKDGLAFKFEDELFETRLDHIEWTPTRSGEISPVAVFDTVEIDGCEVSRATLHNLSFIEGLELMPGNRILVSKRNMIIPQVEENLDRGDFSMEVLVPSLCPCCGYQTMIHTTQKRTDGEQKLTKTLFCHNPNCASQNLRKFVHFVGKKAMDIDGLSEATLEQFIARGWLQDFTDIYRLDNHRDEIIRMDGFGERSWQRLWDAIQKSRNTTFERYLIAMDIPMIGNTASAALGRCFDQSLRAFEVAVDSGYDFTQLPDFGETLHNNIHEWFSVEENRILWEELKPMVNIEKKETAMSVVQDNPFVGKTLVVTGKVEPYTRDGINAKIYSLGAKAGSSVSKNTDYLICGENAGSKLAKAQALGVAVLSPAEFFRMIGEEIINRMTGGEEVFLLRPCRIGGNAMAKKYRVTITETLKRTVDVTAESKEAAEQIVGDEWYSGKHILTADDFIGVEFEANTI